MGRCHNGPVRRPLFNLSALLVGAALMVAVACSGIQDRSGSSNSRGLHGIVRDPALEVAAVSLPEVTGVRAPQPFAMRARPGSLLVVSFGHTNCGEGSCVAVLSALRDAYADLGGEADRLDTAFVTVDPERDTPERLTDHLGSYFSSFHALRTTDPVELNNAEAAFAASSRLTPGDGGSYTVSFSGAAYAVDERGTVVVEWPFGSSGSTIADDLRLLLGERR